VSEQGAATDGDWDSDPLKIAADELARALRISVADAMIALERLDLFRARRANGTGYDDILADQPERSVVEILSESQERLAQVGATFRRATAKMMASNGISQADIARRFGVSRQRIAALLDEPEQPKP
jgi:hypothetical protein